MNEQYAFLNKSEIPSREAWQAAISAAGFDFELDPTLRMFDDTGYRPCRLLGDEAGFEILFEPVTEYDAETIERIAGGKDHCITMAWGGSMRDCAAVMIASYALAQAFGAIISYSGDDPYESLEALLKDTASTIEEAKKE